MPITRRALLSATIATPFVATFATRAHAAAHQVTIQNFAFNPASLSVSPGDTVTFTNADSAPHTATSTQDGVFDTGRLRAGQSATITIGFTGTASYFCEVHPRMRASITSG
ncbi:plastocyanin/azurin family copper-binding protein [Jannaschia sp. S6380]|uniref:plastocyanin/azurin family copper-binding protein n=1 Tax=Jannaschia sp. S6380 TaxID=2926408 RepID=UPI001FF34879|nr:plastocyanin/azurin family copper-binding protein [Jannaschia sp. S6380]MCK0167020.1 plastocyanin/azurin family copper-binding protein [Jannaschia sp. S6380]